MTDYIHRSANPEGGMDVCTGRTLAAGHWHQAGLCLIPLAGTSSTHAAQPAPANWFPDAPSFRQYVWEGAPCPGCEALVPKPAWRRMAALAGVPEVQFWIAPDTSGS